MISTSNVHIKSLKALTPPALLLEQQLIDEVTALHVDTSRQSICDSLHGRSKKLVVVVGPCSIHDPKAAVDYAERIQSVQKQYADQLFLVMRVYFEKPRTRIGWKGLINDPDLDGSFAINKGLDIARSLLLTINRMGIPTGSEFLDTITPQYIADVTTWSAIGARTTESQIHRELASGLSMPVGFKNSTNGSVHTATDAVCAASHPHHFLGVCAQGTASIVSTTGNKDCHIILRGGHNSTNYDSASVSTAVSHLEKNKSTPRVMIDMSHGNSNKEFKKQTLVAEAIAQQLANGSPSIFGVMIESNIHSGNQALTNKDTLKYGVSITDACINWSDTVDIFDRLAEATEKRKATYVE